MKLWIWWSLRGIAVLLGLIVGVSTNPTLGADSPAAAPGDLAKYDALIKPKHRQHWAFQPVRRPAVPVVKDKFTAGFRVDAGTSVTTIGATFVVPTVLTALKSSRS